MEAEVTLAEVAWAEATSEAVEAVSMAVEALSVVGATVVDSAEAPQAGLAVHMAADITAEATAWADPTPADMLVAAPMAAGPLPVE